MSKIIRSTVLLGLSLLLPASLLAATQIAFGGRNPGGHNSRQKNRKPVADQAEAERLVAEATRQAYNIDRLDGQYLLCSSKNGKDHYGLALARITSIRVDSSEAEEGEVVRWQDYTREQPEAIKFYGSEKNAEAFAAGLTYLAAAARSRSQAEGEATLRQFVSQAKAWRESSPKPQMPEAAREHQVLAEYAFKQKQMDKAVREYKSALDIFPTWPEGQFNVATLLSEQKEYDGAIVHMKQYLELVPDSSDAQAAKDSIIIWKDTLNTVFGTAR